MENRLKCLSGNQLKILALLSMTFDHMGKLLFPQYTLFQVFGRLAFPIFAFMIAEGCKYTRNRKKYFGNIFGMGILFQLVFFFTEGSYYQNIFITFSLSILLIFFYDKLQEEYQGIKKVVGVLLAVFVVFGICVWLPKRIAHTGFAIDYGFYGVFLPVILYIPKTYWNKMIVLILGLYALGNAIGGIQMFALLSVPFLAMYNGKRGKKNIKAVFYFYYPLHFVILYLMKMFLMS